MMDASTLIDDVTKLISAGCGLVTLFLAWQKIIPRLEEIHAQTNSLAVKAEAGAHAAGVQEGLKQAAEIDPGVAAAAKLVLDAAADRAAVLLAAAAERADERK
jgi:hypothetical protein